MLLTLRRSLRRMGCLSSCEVVWTRQKLQFVTAAKVWQQKMKRFDGKEITKFDFLNFGIAHEMYHRGQLTVYERLLGVEPALTQYFNKRFD